MSPEETKLAGRGTGSPKVAIIGDSIAHGGNSRDRLGKTLERLLAEPFPGAVVDTYAVPGHTCAQLAERFQGQVVLPGAYDTAIIECGTNDVYNGRDLKDIVADIRTMIAWSREAGLRAIVLDVGPAHGYPDWTDAKEQRRVALNRIISSINGALPVATSEVLSVGDPPRLKDEFFVSDAIHPNDDGLDAMAEKIYSIAYSGGAR